MDSPPSASTIINNEKYLYFAGTSYYELHNDPEIIKSAISATKKFGINTATSRNGYGTSRLIDELEKKTAAFFDSDDSIFLPSGYLTSAAGINALIEYKNCNLIYIDEFSHYSNFDACKLTQLPIIVFNHLDSNDLKKKLSSVVKPNNIPLIVTDGVFPLKGEIAPLDEYQQLLGDFGGFVWVDDSHGVGVLGNELNGTLDYYDVPKSQKIFFGGTFSKAFGGFGGFVAGDNCFIDIIRNGNILRGSNSAPSAAVGANLMGLEILQVNTELKIKLTKNTRYLKQEFQKLGFPVIENDFPVISFSLENEDKNRKLLQYLLDNKIAIQYLSYPGSGNNSVLRLVVFSSHTINDIDYLISKIKLFI